VLHLYSTGHAGAYTIHETLAGSVRLPAMPSAPLPYVPYPTPSGNMFGNAPLTRANEVAQRAPNVLTRAWCIHCNAGERTVVFDHAVAMVQVLAPRYGREQCIDVIGSLMAPGQSTILAARMAAGVPKIAVRASYARWLQCLGDHLYGTRHAKAITMHLAGRTFPLAASFMWSQIVSLMPSGHIPVITAPLSDTTRVATARADFMLEELRTNTVHLELVPVLKRKRKR
jgi:hypothetical protein